MKPETWVQRYDPPIEPGPDGAPLDLGHVWRPTDFGSLWRGAPPYIERTTTRLVRGGQLTQKWRLYLVKDWSRFP